MHPKISSSFQEAVKTAASSVRETPKTQRVVFPNDRSFASFASSEIYYQDGECKCDYAEYKKPISTISDDWLIFDILRAYPNELVCSFKTHEDIYGDCPRGCQNGCTACNTKEYVLIELNNLYAECFYKKFVPADILQIVALMSANRESAENTPTLPTQTTAMFESAKNIQTMGALKPSRSKDVNKTISETVEYLKSLNMSGEETSEWFSKLCRRLELDRQQQALWKLNCNSEGILSDYETKIDVDILKEIQQLEAEGIYLNCAKCGKLTVTRRNTRGKGPFCVECIEE